MLTIDHVVMPVRDAAATLAFYRDVLRLPLCKCFSGDDWGGYPWLMLIFGLSARQELVCVELKGAPSPSYAGMPLDVRHYAFLAESLEEVDGWRERLKGAGLDWWEEDHGGRPSLYFPDPDGVILEITWPAANPPAEEDPEAVAAARRWIAQVRASEPA